MKFFKIRRDTTARRNSRSVAALPQEDLTPIQQQDGLVKRAMSALRWLDSSHELLQTLRKKLRLNELEKQVRELQVQIAELSKWKSGVKENHPWGKKSSGKQKVEFIARTPTGKAPITWTYGGLGKFRW